MQVISKPICELHPAPYNPRQQLEKLDPRYRKLRRSIQRFGLVEPLVWNQQTGNIVGGHQRLQILHELLHQQAFVSVVDFPLDQEKALNVVLNNRQAQGDWDLPKLTSLLEELNELPESQLAATGFDPGHLRTLQSQLTPVEQQVEEDGITRFEITLCIPKEQLQTIRPELDVLIEKYQLEVHVKER